MTAAARPDLLGSVLAAFPGELALSEGPAGFTLTITAVDLRGSVSSGSRRVIEAVARAYERMRHDMRTAAARCVCGDLATSHDMTSKKKSCSAYPCGCTGFQAAGEGTA
jgi:hypothetical protein